MQDILGLLLQKLFANKDIVMRKLLSVLFLHLLVIGIVNAQQKDPAAMYAVGLSFVETNDLDNYDDAYKLFMEAASKGYVPAQAAAAYMLKNGFGVSKDLVKAKTLAETASSAGDGLASWVLAQISEEKQEGNSVIMTHVRKAFDQGYPLSKMMFAKLYAEGSVAYTIPKDENKSLEILRELAYSGNELASPLYGYFLRKTGGSSTTAFKYLELAAEKGNPEAMAQVANMYLYGEGVSKSEALALKYYKSSSDAGCPLGKEGLADCYRLGIGTGGVFNERALTLYNSLSSTSPRVSFLQGYYLNKGEGVAKDVKRALSLFESASEKGNVFAQAFLGISCFDGEEPFEDKDNEKAYPYLLAALNNENFGLLPKAVASQVCQYVAVCKRYGLGTEMDVSDADRLRDKSEQLKSESKGEVIPFGLIGPITPSESISSCGLSWSSEEYSGLLEKVTFDYPKDYLDRAPEQAVVEQPKPVVEEKPQQVAPVTSADPKTPKTPKAAKSGRLAIMIEASPYCFAPTSVVSSRDNNTYWLKGSAIDLSASVGWLSDSGLFIGGGAGFESFSGGRMSVIQGFVDARYFMGGSGSGLFLGARGGVGMGSPEYGIGISAAGLLGYKIAFGGNMGLNIGLKAGINSFTDDNKTMGNVVGPFVEICF